MTERLYRGYVLTDRDSDVRVFRRETRGHVWFDKAPNPEPLRHGTGWRVRGDYESLRPPAEVEAYVDALIVRRGFEGRFRADDLLETP